jgi:hypothetical protein
VRKKKKKKEKRKGAVALQWFKRCDPPKCFFFSGMYRRGVCVLELGGWPGTIRAQASRAALPSNTIEGGVEEADDKEKSWVDCPGLILPGVASRVCHV